MTTTKNSKDIKATQETLYQAFTNPSALIVWLPPGEMKGKIHKFDLRVDGGYEMSLFYPLSEQDSRGKSSENEDRFTARFIELIPYKKIVQAINFDSSNHAFLGEMIMETTFEANDSGTKVTILFKNIPPGIRPEDNEVGTELSLENLARYIEEG
jgi:uncharacterized protein YndB with AHSA1/START domain